MNAITIRKVIIFLCILGTLVVITIEAAHYARADDGDGTTPDHIMAPLDEGYDSDSEVDSSFENTWWCQEASCEIDYGAIVGDPTPPDPPPSDPPPSDPPPSDPPPSDPQPSDPLFDYCASLMGAPEYAQPCLDDPAAYGWGRAFAG